MQTFHQYGIDWEGPVPLDSDTDEIVVPSVPCPLNDYKLQALREVLDPLQECDDYGV